MFARRKPKWGKYKHSRQWWLKLKAGCKTQNWTFSCCSTLRFHWKALDTWQCSVLFGLDLAFFAMLRGPQLSKSQTGCSTNRETPHLDESVHKTGPTICLNWRWCISTFYHWKMWLEIQIQIQLQIQIQIHKTGSAISLKWQWCKRDLRVRKSFNSILGDKKLIRMWQVQPCQNPSLWKNIEKRTDLQSLRSVRSVQIYWEHIWHLQSVQIWHTCSSVTCNQRIQIQIQVNKYTNTNIHTNAKKSSNVMNFIKSGR